MSKSAYDNTNFKVVQRHGAKFMNISNEEDLSPSNSTMNIF